MSSSNGNSSSNGTGTRTIDVAAFALQLRRFMEQMARAVPAGGSALGALLAAHLGADPLELPLSSTTLPTLEHADLQLALDAHLAADGRTHEWAGLGAHGHPASLPHVIEHGGERVVPVGRLEVATGVEEMTTCVTSGAALVTDAVRGTYVVAVRRLDGLGERGALHVDVLAADATTGPVVLADLRRRMASTSVHRGHVLALGGASDPWSGDVGVSFLPRPSVDRASLVLPEGLLEQIEERTLRFDEVAERLAAAGHHRRRGVLLHGPPGTGKTMTVRYLIGRQRDRTVIVLTGAALLGGIATAAALARRLEPATIVLEDVDLVARQRQLGPVGNPVLLELLNALDGLGGDADVLVLLTTNRPDLVESALAARPGRVDLAVELPLPALEERRRLLAATVGATAPDVDLVATAARIEGVTASFVPELARTAALRAAVDGSDVVSAAHLGGAVDELLASGSLRAAWRGEPGDGDATDATDPDQDVDWSPGDW